MKVAKALIDQLETTKVLTKRGVAVFAGASQ